MTAWYFNGILANKTYFLGIFFYKTYFYSNSTSIEHINFFCVIVLTNVLKDNKIDKEADKLNITEKYLVQTLLR